jgi:dTDP-4-amino-4,6-dideoxygalactose transaminase
MISLVDLKAQYQSIKKEIDLALQDTLESGHFIHGKNVEAFEKEFASYIGSRYCVGLNSGTDALTLGIRALGLNSGDNILIPANAHMAIVEAIDANRLIPVFVDINTQDYGFDLVDLQKKITSKTKAIIVAHMFGQPGKIEEIQDILNESDHSIHLIEDVCQATGARYRDKRVGSFGIFSAFSFYPGKNLGAYGDAGALVTSNPKIASMVRLLQDHGQDGKFRHTIVGSNSRLDEIQAGVLRVKLRHLDKWNALRQEIAEYYGKQCLEKVPFISTPYSQAEWHSVYYAYIIRVPDRDRLAAYLKRHDIKTLVYYPTAPHLQRAAMHLGYVEGDMPHAEECAATMLGLPIYPELSAEECRYIVDTIESFYAAHA